MDMKEYYGRIKGFNAVSLLGKHTSKIAARLEFLYRIQSSGDTHVYFEDLIVWSNDE